MRWGGATAPGPAELASEMESMTVSLFTPLLLLLLPHSQGPSLPVTWSWAEKGPGSAIGVMLRRGKENSELLSSFCLVGPTRPGLGVYGNK